MHSNTAMRFSKAHPKNRIARVAFLVKLTKRKSVEANKEKVKSNFIFCNTWMCSLCRLWSSSPWRNQKKSLALQNNNQISLRQFLHSANTARNIRGSTLLKQFCTSLQNIISLRHKNHNLFWKIQHYSYKINWRYWYWK